MMTDPIADMLSRIRNGQHARHKTVNVPASRLKRAILNVLKEEGYIREFSDVEGTQHPTLCVELKYVGGKGVMSEIARMSRPGMRSYASAKNIPLIRNGLGTAIVSTSQGVMTDAKAKELNLGGELLCRVF